MQTIDIQKELEEESSGMGIKRYRENLAARGEDNLPPGLTLMKKTIEPLAAAIQKCVDDGLEGKASRSVSVVQFLSQFEPDAVAFMTARTVLHYFTSTSSVSNVAMELASRLEGLLNYDKLKAEDPAAHARLMRVLRNHPGLGLGLRTVIVRKQQKWANVTRIKWDQGDKLRLGTLLIELMINTTGLCQIEKQMLGVHKTLSILVATPSATKWLSESHSRCELLTPYHMPMVVKPLSWSTPWDGGYLSKTLKYPIIKTGNKQYLEELSYTDMPMVYRSINALQDTPWSINKAVFNVLSQVWDSGGRLGKLPPREDDPIPPRPYEDQTTAPDDVVRTYKAMASKMLAVRYRNQAKRAQLVSKLWVAEKFSQHERFYFPYALDWRGRAYPVSAGITPQGDDIAKGLLRFADGKALGENGAYWLAVHGAGCAGVDKVTFDERVQWVGEHHDEIIDSALNPLDGKRFWSTMDKPYQFLAFCFEWLGYSISGSAHVSHLQVAFDGTCNGLQNFSAMLRDEVGGKAVGLVPTEAPQDIYTEVAKAAEVIIAADAAGGDSVAQRWSGKMTRKLTKRNTMTTPYGVSEYGMRDQLKAEFEKLAEDGVDFGFNPGFGDVQYLAGVNFKAISQTVVAAREAMQWLTDTAKVVAANDLPVSWTTPSGLPVLQSYRKTFGKKFDFDIEGKRFRIVLRVDEDNLDRAAQSRGISPNFVHSLDAAHMVRTVDYCLDSGVTHFAMIHDSYGCHAADADTLCYELRRAFVDQYSGNMLEEFRTQLVSGLPPELADKVRPVPQMGTLDISAIMDSQYFFA